MWSGRMDAGRTCPSANADAALERDERRWVRDARPIEVRSRLASQVQHVLEALVGDERGACAAPAARHVVGRQAFLRHTRGGAGRDGGQRIEFGRHRGAQRRTVELCQIRLQLATLHRAAQRPALPIRAARR